MKILILKNGRTVAELGGTTDAARYLGWSSRTVAMVLESGILHKGFKLRSAPDKEREGTAVCAYTATTCFRYTSVSACARAYSVSRKSIEDMIEKGKTHDDGMTTFDFPCY